MRKLALALMCAASTGSGTLNAEPIQQIKADGSDVNGPAKVDFPPDTTMEDFGPAPILSFEGTWINGLAQGEGLVKFADTPGAQIGKTNSPGGRNYYIGEFKDGVPRGEGQLVSTMPPDYMAPVQAHTQTIDGAYTGKQVTMSTDSQRVAVFTKLENEPAALVLLMQYPSFDASSPSRVYYGRADMKGVSGSWVDLPWYRQLPDGVVLAGFGSTIEAFFPHGGSQRCTGEAAMESPALVRDLMGQSFPVDQRKAALDPHLSVARAECLSTNSEGWTWRFKVDNTTTPPALTYIECRLPNGKPGRLRNGGSRCEEKERRKFDVFTNVFREFQRVLNRDIVGNIDKAGASLERAMCRATGTQEGINCNIGIQIGASWPVGDGPAPNLSPDEAATRQAYVVATKRANALTDAMADRGAVGEAAALTASLNAICSSLCAEQSQRTYSASLLSELEAVAPQPLTDDNLRIISRVNRETASLMSRGLVLAIAGGVGAVAFKDFTASVGRMERIQTAMELVNEATASAATFQRLKQGQVALASLVALQKAEANRAALEGVRIIYAPILATLKILSGISPTRRAVLMTAIQMGRTSDQVAAFVKKYQNVQTEEELQEAIIKESLLPLGINWPPKDH
ncbi:hypothetical protein ACOYW6_12725 [Parablastomonas sp. CN1-191]|uniref:hypothetical protein n=1 Tax=Parablastomonas sp. CN1-191 TaxID=3400908 RepID=UPI003BF82D1B